jgi:zinc transport system permease protein
MVIALLTMPAAISSQFVKDTKHMMVLASILGIVFTTTGLWLSYFLNLTSGATIILVAGAVYLLSLAAKSLKQRTHLEDKFVRNLMMQKSGHLNT